MFLNILNFEERNRFAELMYKVAQSDNDYADDEKELIENYKKELGITNILDTRSIDELLDYFALKSIQTQKLVWFELYGMLMADSIITKEENIIANKVKCKFKISSDQIDTIKSAADSLQIAYDKVYECLA